jgi:glycosyltransferase involved in cell wall biosynthesis
MNKAVILPFPATPTTRRRIAFVINSLGPGGAERVLDNILHMAPEGEWECHLILLDQEHEHRTPPDFVTIHRLDCRLHLLPSVRQLRERLLAIRPDLVVSFLVRANIAAIIASRAIGAPCIISERSHLTTHFAERHRGLQLAAASLASRLAYPRAHHVIAVSEGVRTDLIQNFGVMPHLSTSIPNPYDLEGIARAAEIAPEFPLPDRFMVSAGRLVGAKGFDDLIRAYAIAQPPIPLVVLGEGAERPYLQSLIASLGLQERILLPGYAKNPFAIVGRAEMFVSASHCEGFPNAMAEAMALGLPIVATDCPSGPAEILAGVETTGSNGIVEVDYGILVPVRQPDMFARAITLMSDPKRRQHYAVMARRRMDDYRIHTIAARYWKTFANVLDRRPVATPQAGPRPEAGRETA